ncbi:alkene reductase [Acinetobacter guillouiae]|uniref:alkene reductase n=1 Tax=Acinetobacter guillouiae TaxID=106649 RepID=UPI00300AD30D
MKNIILNPVNVAQLLLKNRIVMAPMTRSRAKFDGVPGDLALEYYSQRVGVGLIVTEGTQPSDEGQGYLTTPGIYTTDQINGWKKIIDSVHANNGKIFIQLMHAGRMSHPDNTINHIKGVAPSAIAPGAPMFTLSGMKDIPVPRELSQEDIANTIQDFRHAAKCAIIAGADGVEIHGANAYLIQQFFAPSSNTRDDQYGGSIENRARFALEVVGAIADEVGADKTAIRLSPGTTLWGIDEGEQGADLYRYLVKELNKQNLAYIHIVAQGDEQLLVDIRKYWDKPLILNRPGRPRDQIGSDIANGLADLESYGQLILTNPDFVQRLEHGAQFNEADRNTYFGGDAKGYIDYPTLGIKNFE